MSDENPLDLDDSDTVYLAASRTRSGDSPYHIDTECKRGPSNPQKRTFREVKDRDPCAVCVLGNEYFGGGHAHAKGDRSVLQSIQAHVAEETGEDIFEGECGVASLDDD